jgi:GNAT superfamily N-acetyltransferase
VSISYVVAEDGTPLSEALYALRYEVYAKELGAQLDGIHNGLLRDELDEHAYNYLAIEDGRALGSLRIVDLPHIRDRTRFAGRYRTEVLTAFFQETEISYAGRLAVRKEVRRSPIMVRLMQTAARDARQRGIRVTFSDCSPQHLDLYESIAYTRYGSPFVDEVFGYKIPILWVLGDLELQRKKRSPLLRATAEFGDDWQAREWFKLTIRRASPEAAQAESVAIRSERPLITVDAHSTSTALQALRSTTEHVG